MNEKTKSLEKVGLGFAVMFGIFWLYSLFIAKYLNINYIFNNIIGLICLYGVGRNCKYKS